MSVRRGSFDDSDIGGRPGEKRKLVRTNSFDKLTASLTATKVDASALERPLDIGSTPEALTTSAAPLQIRKRTYAGLANQGATCYMNSLLQTLFMTPEFRRVLYMWKYEQSEDEDEEDCIPLQLQLLFGQLQLTGLRAATTTALTKSFGWTGRESFQQHDVQELARVLFDALERSLGRTANSQLINALFKGTLHDYVQCKKCGHERSRIDNFLDLSLVIKPFGATKAMGSVEEALSDYIKQEVMDGADKVTCDTCGERTPSVKGLKIAEPPYLLQLQLKRFVFDYATMDREKLNDRVTYPLVLDLNKYVERVRAAADSVTPTPTNAEVQVAAEPEPKAVSEAEAPAGAGAGAAAAAVESASGGASQLNDGTGGSREGVDVEAGGSTDTDATQDTQDAGTPLAGMGAFPAVTTALPAPETRTALEVANELVARNGPHVYELYAVLVHSGGARAGHYYAYIKDLDTQEWYSFNDSSVTPIGEKEVLASCGGETKSGYGSYSYSYASSANAYMLMYRKVLAGVDSAVVSIANASAVAKPVASGQGSDAASVSVGGGATATAPTSSLAASVTEMPRWFPSDAEVPAAVLGLLAKQEEAEKAREQVEVAARASMNLKVYYGKASKYMAINRSATVGEATKKAWEMFDLAGPQGNAGETAPIVAVGAGDSMAAAAVLVPTPSVPLECVRLRKFAAHTDTLKEPLPFTLAAKRPASPQSVDSPRACVCTPAPAPAPVAGSGGSDATGGGGDAVVEAPVPPTPTPCTLESLGIHAYTDLMLETKPTAEEEWPEYDPDGIVISLVVFVEESGEFRDPVKVTVNKDATLQVLEERIAKATGIPRERQRLLKLNSYGMNPECREVLTNVSLGLPPLTGPAPTRAGLPVDSLLRTIGDTMTLGADLGLRYYDAFKLYVEQLPEAAVVDSTTFDPFGASPTPGPAVTQLATEQESSAKGADSNAAVTASGGVTLHSFDANSTPTADAAASTANTDKNNGNDDADNDNPEAPAASPTVPSPVAASVPPPAPAPAPANSIVNPFASSTRAYAGFTSTPPNSSYNERGLRPIAADASPAVAAFERSLYTVDWKYTGIGESEATHDLKVDQRISARDLYAVMAVKLGVPEGTFLLRRETATGRAIKVSDQAGCLRDAAWWNAKGGVLHVSAGPTPHSTDFLGAIVLRLPDSDVIPGPEWIGEAPPPSHPATHPQVSTEGESSVDVGVGGDGVSAGAGATPATGVADVTYKGWFYEPLTAGEVSELQRCLRAPATAPLPVPPVVTGVEVDTDDETAPPPEPVHVQTSKPTPGCLIPICKVLFTQTTPVARLLEDALPHVREHLKDETLSVSRLRLRAKTGVRVGPIFAVNGEVADQYAYGYDGLEFCVEAVPLTAPSAPMFVEEKRPSAFATKSTVKLIYVAWWDRARWAVTRRREMIVRTNETLRALAQRIASVPGVADASRQCVEAARGAFPPPPPPPKAGVVAVHASTATAAAATAAAASSTAAATSSSSSGSASTSCPTDDAKEGDATATPTDSDTADASAPSAFSEEETPMARLLRALTYVKIDTLSELPGVGKLPSMGWKSMKDDERTVGSYSVAIEDGCTILLADADMPVRPLTRAEKAVLNIGVLKKPSDASSDPSNPSFWSSMGKASSTPTYSSVASRAYTPRKESGIQILTKSERDAKKAKEKEGDGASPTSRTEEGSSGGGGAGAGAGATSASSSAGTASAAPAAEATTGHFTMRDLLPGGGARRESASTFSNPMFRHAGSAHASAHGGISTGGGVNPLLSAEARAQEEREMARAAEPDPVTLSTRQFCAEAGLDEDASVVPGGMALFDEFF